MEESNNTIDMSISKNKINQENISLNVSPNNTEDKSTFERKFSVTELNHKRMNFIRNFINNEEKLEDEHLTEEYFNSIFIDEMISTIFVGLSIGSGIIYYEIRTCNPLKCKFEYNNEIINISLFSVSCANMTKRN